MADTPTPITYDSIESSLRTGDVFVARGLFDISKLIESITGSTWSHSAIVVRAEDLGIENTGPVLVWESTLETNLPDVIEHKSKIGPMLVDLRERIATDIDQNFYKLFAIRHLNVERTPDMIAGLKNAIREVHTAIFPSYLKMVAETLEGMLLDRQAPDSNFFCSELVAYTFMQMGLLSTDPVANSYEPKSFSSKGHVKFLQGATLGPEIWINAV